MRTLFDSLDSYGQSDAYPFHMPGHKRNVELLKEMYGGADVSPYSIDITEIDGFDNLHHAEGILCKAQDRAAALYKARESFFLINGSTCGLLAAVYACTKQGGAILMARNCHKVVYHAAELRELDTYYLYPDVDTESGLNGAIHVSDVENSLREHPEVSAVLITSPTYDGIVSDVRRIARIVHEYGKVLIVDEAHGAHFGFSTYFPENSLEAGADVVVHSLHKTLPAYTQTALLSVGMSSEVSSDALRKYLGMFETSSPSYVMMAGMDQCICYLEQKKEQLFAAFEEKLKNFYAFAEMSLKHIIVVNRADKDPSKLVLFAEGLTGHELAQILRSRFYLEVEMEAKDYVIALTSIFDTREGFERLKDALRCISDDIDKNEKQKKKETQNKEVTRLFRAMKISEAAALSMQKQVLCCKLDDWDQIRKSSRISGEYIYLYPPGIPLAAPGEMLTEELILELEVLKKAGFEIQGLRDYSGGEIQIIDINQ